MKKVAALLCAVLLIGLAGCTQTQTEEGPQRLVLSEVVHSVFYAPQYVAMELGFFEEEGIDLEVDVGNGADKCMTAVISGNAMWRSAVRRQRSMCTQKAGRMYLSYSRS